MLLFSLLLVKEFSPIYLSKSGEARAELSALADIEAEIGREQQKKMTLRKARYVQLDNEVWPDVTLFD